MTETYKLTYFNIRGLAEPIRMMFAVAGVPFEDVRVSKDDWPELKKKFVYQQLPVLEVGEGKTLAQSNAILRFLANKFNLTGANAWDDAKMDELTEVLADVRTEWRKLFVEKDEEKKAQVKKELIEVTFPKLIGKVEEYKKAQGSKYLVGDKLTWIDILYAHFMDSFGVTLDPNIMDPYPCLKELQNTVFEVPEIKKWIETRPKTDF